MMQRIDSSMKGAACLVCVFLISCGAESQYSGDGVLVDYGPSAATDRYVVTLGEVDIGQSSVDSYSLSNLPEANFVIGLVIDTGQNDQKPQDAAILDAVVNFELKDQQGKVLVSREAPLAQWAWTIYADGRPVFVYGRSEYATYFDATPDTQYMLIVSVTPAPDLTIQLPASVIAKSGGWK